MNRLGIGTLFACAALTGLSLVMAGPAWAGDNSQMRVTLTDHGCTYRGDTSAAAGRFTIAVKNQTERGANFAFIRLAKGFTAVTVRPILAEETAYEALALAAAVEPPLNPEQLQVTAGSGVIPGRWPTQR